MRDLNEKWIRGNGKEYQIEELKRIRSEIINCGRTYQSVFNGEPFFEEWTLDSAIKEIEDYQKDNALILTTRQKEQIIGFLVSINKVPESQREFVQYLENIIFVEEIGVLSEFRKLGIASEMVRILLLKYLLDDIKYLGYRTNAMRYFDFYGRESFESKVIRVQKEDKIKRMNGEKIIVPKLNFDEKQQFINLYIELIKNNPELDVSNSNALFRNIFGTIDFNMINGNYTFQKDPTGENNDRIFPIIDLSKTLSKKRD